MGWLADNISAGKTRFARDSIFALVSRVMPKIASGILFLILIYRNGSAPAGAFSLAVAFLTSAVMLSSIGMEELVIREVAKEPSSSFKFLVNTLILRGIFALIGYGILVGLVTLVFNYDTTVQRIIMLQGSGILPEGFIAIFFSIFNGNKKFKWMALVSFGENAFQLIIGGLALWIGAKLEILIVVLLGGSWFGVLIGFYLFIRLANELDYLNVNDNVNITRNWRPDWGFCKQVLTKTIPFAVIISITSLDLQLDIILLSALNTISEVGIYSAARLVVTLLSILPQAIRMVIYPSMTHAYATSKAQIYRIYSQSWYYLALIGLPITLGGAILARPILDIIYRQQVPVTMVWALSVLMIDLLANFIYLPSTRLMVISDHQILLSILLGFSMGITILIGYALIPYIGIVGISIARAAASWVYFLSVEFYVLRFILPRHRGIIQAIKPLFATLVMAIIVWFLRKYSLFLVIPTGALLYGLLMISLNIPYLSKSFQH